MAVQGVVQKRQADATQEALLHSSLAVSILFQERKRLVTRRRHSARLLFGKEGGQGQGERRHRASHVSRIRVGASRRVSLCDKVRSSHARHVLLFRFSSVVKNETNQTKPNNKVIQRSPTNGSISFERAAQMPTTNCNDEKTFHCHVKQPTTTIRFGVALERVVHGTADASNIPIFVRQVSARHRCRSNGG